MFHWPLKVEIHRSTVSTDGFHSKSIIQSKILNNYFIFTVSQMFCVQLKKKMGRISICKFTWIGRQRRKICAKVLVSSLISETHFAALLWSIFGEFPFSPCDCNLSSIEETSSSHPPQLLASPQWSSPPPLTSAFSSSISFPFPFLACAATSPRGSSPKQGMEVDFLVTFFAAILPHISAVPSYNSLARETASEYVPCSRTNPSSMEEQVHGKGRWRQKQVCCRRRKSFEGWRSATVWSSPSGWVLPPGRHRPPSRWCRWSLCPGRSGFFGTCRYNSFSCQGRCPLGRWTPWRRSICWWFRKELGRSTKLFFRGERFALPCQEAAEDKPVLGLSLRRCHNRSAWWGSWWWRWRGRAGRWSSRDGGRGLGLVFLERQVHVQQTCGGELVTIVVSFMTRSTDLMRTTRNRKLKNIVLKKTQTSVQRLSCRTWRIILVDVTYLLPDYIIK